MLKPTEQISVYCFLVALLVLVSATWTVKSQSVLRSLQPDDLSKLHELGQVSFSPSGDVLAFVLKRPKQLSRSRSSPFLDGNDRSDVWLIPSSGSKARNLTNGQTDGSGWWSPIWSPDGSRLAFLSTRGGNVRLWVWQRSWESPRQLTSEGIDLLPAQAPPIVWLDNHQLVCALLPKGQKPNMMTLETRAPEAASREWPKAWLGQESTASVLESGIERPLGQRQHGRIALIDVRGNTRSLADGYSFRDIRLSPTGRNIAALQQIDIVRPDPTSLLTHGRPPVLYRSKVIEIGGRRILSDLDKVNDVQPSSLRWSADGKKLFLIGRFLSENLVGLVCTLTTDSCNRVADAPLASNWSENGDLLVNDSASRRWVKIDSTGEVLNLTLGSASTPREILRESTGNSFVGLANGEIWRIFSDGRVPENLTTNFEPNVISIVHPNPSNAQVGNVSQLVLSVRREGEVEWRHLDLQSGRLTFLKKPSANASLVEFDAQARKAALMINDRNGTYLHLSSVPFDRLTNVVEANQHLREIAESQFLKIEYQGLNGQKLNGWILLPVRYETGKRYPLVTVVYGGVIFGDAPPGMASSINSSRTLNYHLVAAMGYAVLFPSIPLRPEGKPSDPYLDMPKSVLPAVDKALELGIADPKRLAVFGQSYGGYGVYSLITQTNKFRVAVSLAGLSDLVSLYGMFDARFRYDEFAHERIFNMSLAETGQVRMGNPPWKDIDRFLRNSPVNFVDRIETPLMIVQGDMDFVAMQQGEQMFSSLYRQGKRASFVRYWGEGHVIESPANVRDMWERIHRWLETFLN